MNEAVRSWAVQLRKGAAEIAILSLLSQHPLSGVGLVETLEKHPNVGIAEGSVYPLLSRLEKEGRIKGQWQPSTKGARSQKVYALTAEGRAILADMEKVWHVFKGDLNGIIAGGTDD